MNRYLVWIYEIETGRGEWFPFAKSKTKYIINSLHFTIQIEHEIYMAIWASISGHRILCSQMVSNKMPNENRSRKERKMSEYFKQIDLIKYKFLHSYKSIN